MSTKNSIVVTGGSGRFGASLKKSNFFRRSNFPTKKQLDILKVSSILNYLKKKNLNMLSTLRAYQDLCLSTM